MDDDISIDELLAAVSDVPQETPITWDNKVIITCINCKTQFVGELSVSKKWFDKDHQFHYATYYCPNCPKIESLIAWGQKILVLKSIEMRTI